jgi:hypothetical protein
VTAVNCGENNYDIELYECSGGGIVTIAGMARGTTCRQFNPSVPLKFCDAANYVCLVTNFPGGGLPTEPVYVEWHWTIDYTHPVSGRPGYYNGKLVYVATVEWLQNLYNSSGYPIPLLNQTNHTVKL